MEFFEFPIICIDPDYEQNKREKATGSLDSSVEYTIGMAQITPDARLIKLNDSWLPTEDDFRLALDGEFNACTAAFDGIGSYDIPMTRQRFMKMYNKFQEKLEKSKPQVEIIHLQTKEQIQEFLKQLNNGQEKTEPESESDRQPD